MCTTCGCGSDQVHVDGTILHQHDHDYSGSRRAHVHEHGVSDVGESRRVRIERAVLAKNDRYAQTNRQLLAEHGILMLNLVSSPGSGKTTLLVETIRALQSDLSIAVIEGDQQTDQDAMRVRATGVQALQINTGKGCHLDAHMVGHAIQRLDLQENSALFIENVGNLVCPAGFDLGEAHKVVILSVTEGEDKPLKYPDMFRAADLMLLNKCDLLPYLSFDVCRVIEYAHRVNPSLQIIQVSATLGTGMPAWFDWIKRSHHCAVKAKRAIVSTQHASD
ncbi:hydrogenase nickel incorporation protein HypB [Nitrosomonas marina]|uniref:Hydrogenase maturation factor HypB n=1 Tax=Nitrosomonas marina TaxID=917 RepID=A0A1I0BP70_9PROT|nr:hydrogenase nickel incorporation protein HypB [Nitrosomonas marina]SET08421.1 hydrogenase nickel incorporation protein HypB [Nitrosomonas marina]